MATRQPFWKWHISKSISFFPYTLVMCYWSLDLICKAKQKLESGNRNIQDGHQAAILKVTSLKSIGFCPWPPKHAYGISNWNSKANLSYALETMSPADGRKGRQMDGQTDRQTNRQTDRQTDGQTARQTDSQTDRQGESSIPPPTSLGGGIKSHSKFVDYTNKILYNSCDDEVSNVFS